MKKSPHIKPLGYLGMSIMGILFFISVISTIYFRKKLGLKTWQLITLIIIKSSFFAFLAFSYFRQRKCGGCPKNEDLSKGIYDEDYRVYQLLVEGGYKNFQYWYASLASDIIMEIIFLLLLFMIPFPFISKGIGRIHGALVKLGLYKLSLMIILGKPIYIINRDYWKELNNTQRVETYVMFVLLIIFLTLVTWETWFMNKK